MQENLLPDEVRLYKVKNEVMKCLLKQASINNIPDAIIPFILKSIESDIVEAQLLNISNAINGFQNEQNTDVEE